MTLKEKYLNTITEHNYLIDEQRTKTNNKLVNYLSSVLNNKQTIEFIEQKLIQKGTIELDIAYSGCLCEDGFCSSKKGVWQRTESLLDKWYSENEVKFYNSICLCISVTGKFGTQTKTKLPIEICDKYKHLLD